MSALTKTWTQANSAASFYGPDGDDKPADCFLIFANRLVEQVLVEYRIEVERGQIEVERDQIEVESHRIEVASDAECAAC